MEGLTFQPGNLNILVSSLGKGTANLTLGMIYQASVIEQVGIDKFLLQVGGQQVLAENQANLQVGEALKLLVKEAGPGRLILQRVTANGESHQETYTPFSEGNKRIIGLLKRLLGTENNSPSPDKLAEGGPKASTTESAPLIFPLAITWQNLPLKGELHLWNWEREQGKEQGEDLDGDKAWRALLHVDSLSLGEVKADIFLYKKDIQVLFRSQGLETQKIIEENFSVLKQALELAGLQVKKLAYRSGVKEMEKQTFFDNRGLDMRV